VSAVKEMALTPAPEQSVVLSESDALMRAAMDPNVDMAKLNALIDMRERVMKIQAKAAFDSAFALMQSDIPEIDERGKLIVKGVLRSTYARLEDIHAAIKPVLSAHGFAIRHRTEWPEGKANTIRIVGILSHRQGHSEESIFEAPMDRSEYRSDIQSMGSTVSYGRRYTTLDLLNITTRGLDDDARPKAPKAPEGYDEWLSTLAGPRHSSAAVSRPPTGRALCPTAKTPGSTTCSRPDETRRAIAERCRPSPSS